MEVVRIDVQLPAVKSFARARLYREDIDGELGLRMPEYIAKVSQCAIKELRVSGHKSQSEMLHTSTVAHSTSYVYLSIRHRTVISIPLLARTSSRITTASSFFEPSVK
jgi:hypothetical protein